VIAQTAQGGDVGSPVGERGQGARCALLAASVAAVVREVLGDEALGIFKGRVKNETLPSLPSVQKIRTKTLTTNPH
jgi:hypothetical protein